MASNVVRATLLADAQRFKAGFKEAETAAGGFESKVENTASVVRAALAGAAVAAIRAFVDDSIRAFSELEQATGAIESVFGRAKDTIEDFARSSDKSVGLSESSFKALAARLGGMLQNYGFDAETAAQKTIELIARGSDMAATYGGPVSEAVSAIAALLRGEADPIERYAVSIKVADINARALALGLADSTTEIDNQSKATAALDLLLDQTSKTAGQFAREEDTVAGAAERAAAQLENAKARLGETLQEFDKFKSGLQQTAAEGLSLFALGIGRITGQLDDYDVGIRAFEVQTGRAADSAAALLTIWSQGGVDLGELTNRMPLATSELHKLRDATDEFLESLGLTSEEIENFRELLADKLVAAGRAARDEGIHAAVGGMKELRTETEETTSALERFESEVRSQTDPLFGLVAATNNVAGAQRDVTAAAAEFGENSPEHVAALLELVQKSEELVAAQLKVAEQSGMTRDQFAVHLRSMTGITEVQIAAILAEFDRVNAFDFVDKAMTVTVRTRNVTGGGVQEFADGRAGGGRVREGDAYRVGEMGEEIFVPDEDGTIVPNHWSGRGGTPVDLTADLAKILIEQTMLLRRLVEGQQRNGTKVILDGREIAESIRVWDRTWLPD